MNRFDTRRRSKEELERQMSVLLPTKSPDKEDSGGMFGINISGKTSMINFTGVVSVMEIFLIRLDYISFGLWLIPIYLRQ